MYRTLLTGEFLMRINIKVVTGSLVLIVVISLFSFGPVVVAGEGASKQPNVPFKFAVGKKKYPGSTLNAWLL
jgi:hypothetical protein